ncbi:hypothetical protein DUI87_00775 [Hirundo rustica rustica]|uniref:Uncharacterized protein n=1 Tax=Hirundo rustica rustica TaxID=333673 RepID=A0A3M0LBF2_HIRRU|nr:hypothetical protein DUI87_00775 [Hirundo rustica rustica]
MNLVVRVYCWPPDQEEPIDETFLIQLWEALHFQARVLLEDFNHLHVFQESSMVSCQETPGMHGGKLPDPSNTESYQRGFSGHQCELIEDIKVGDSLRGRDHALEEFTIYRDMGQERGKDRPLGSKKAKFQLFNEIVHRIL